MEFFANAKTVKLGSHHGKYLIPDDNKEKVQQSRDGSSRNARWEVEFVNGKSDVVRLKSFHGLYLTASPEPFLLGMTGEKVIQTVTPTPAVEWKPIRHGSAVKLETAEGQFLRANWGMPPWRNSVNHNVPFREMTHDWVLWTVEVVDVLPTNHSSAYAPAQTPAPASTSVPARARPPPRVPARQVFSGILQEVVNAGVSAAVSAGVIAAINYFDEMRMRITRKLSTAIIYVIISLLCFICVCLDILYGIFY